MAISIGNQGAPVLQPQPQLAAAGWPLLQSSTSAEQQGDEIELDLREVYFLIMHFLSSGPCQRATGQLWNELLQHKLLPRRYHALYSRHGLNPADEDDDGTSFPLSYAQVSERFHSIDKGHLVKLLQQLLLHDRSASLLNATNGRPLTAADVPTLLGSGAFSLLESEQRKSASISYRMVEQLRWPHWQADQVHALGLRQLGGGFARHHRCPSTRTPKHVIAKPSVLVDRIRIIKVLRGHRNAVYCAIFDRTGQYFITGSDDRLVKFWSAESGLCLRSCRGHEGDITHLGVNIANTLVASASNDSSIRVWRHPDGVPVAVLRGHTASVTAIQFRPRYGCENHLLSSSDDGTCRIWDARDSSIKSRVFMPKAAADGQQAGNPSSIQISCCAFNADGNFFVTGSSDKLARVWDARKWEDEYNYELDILRGHEDIVNYVQFSGCAEAARPFPTDVAKEDNVPRFKNSWFAQDSIVTCSKDGSAIIWSPRPRKQVKLGRWVKSYHLKVPPPPVKPPHTRGGGPRQRHSATPRGVNMIVWSLDNRFVLATIMDCRICVWNAVDGSLLHCLTGHTKQTFVLVVHPYNPRVAMSAGYDGRVIIWDIWEGRPVRTYETGDYNLVDGNFSPDGTSLVVSDEVGQVYLLGTGMESSQKDAKYDQFFLGDFRPLVRDTHGNVLDQETQLPPHQRNLQDLLCDSGMIPYPEPYQSTYQQRRLGTLGINWSPPAVPLAVGTLDDVPVLPEVSPPPPRFVEAVTEHAAASGNRWVEQPTDVDGMDWDEEATGLSEDSGSDYCASEESISDDGVAESESVYDDGTTDSEAEIEVDDADEDRGRPRRSSRKRKKDEDTFGNEAKRSRREILVDAHAPRRLKRSSAEDRPLRAAARNARSMFTSMTEVDEDEEGKGTADEGRETVPEPSTNAAETSEAGECRRPRSQRKLVLKLRNKHAGEQLPTFESDDAGEVQPESGDDVRIDRKGKRVIWKKMVQTSSSDDGLTDIVGPAQTDKEETSPHTEREEGDEQRSPGAVPVAEGGELTTPSRQDEQPPSEKDEDGQALPGENDEAHSREDDQILPEEDEQQPAMSNDSLQNADDDPDYHDEEITTNVRMDSESDRENTPEPPSRRMKQTVFCRNNRGARKQKHGGEAGPPAAVRKSKRRSARATTTRRRVPTRRRRASTSFKGAGSSSSANEDSEWSEKEEESSSEDGASEVPKLRRRSSARLRQAMDYRYRDFQLKRKTRLTRCSGSRDPDTSSVAWLLSTEVDRQRYIPQLGDLVVYLRQGHQDHLEQAEAKEESGPWSEVRHLRAVEYCEVVRMEYAIVAPSGQTCCDLTLKFSEGRLRGRTFALLLPELTHCSDFIVERSRYEAALARKWSCRDKCRVWWRSEEESGSGEWWEGRVTEVKPKSNEFPDSPWDSVKVRYKEEPQDILHSPWELFDTDDNCFFWESQRIDEERAGLVLDTINNVLQSSQSKDEYGLWRLQQAITKPDFYERTPLPLSMEVIKARLESSYYRSLVAVAHDINTMISNFVRYFGEEHASVLKLERLKDRFAGILNL